MYESFFGFREKPFNLTPDPRFLYLSAKHSEAFAHLEFGLKQRGGFVVVSGEVGTGKTTLCRYFLDRLDENTLSAFILYPALSAVELLRSINDDWGITPNGEEAKIWSMRSTVSYWKRGGPRRTSCWSSTRPRIFRPTCWSRSV